MNGVRFDHAAVLLVLSVHLAWILWVIFGAFWTFGRPWLTALHIASLVWGIMVEVGPWPCPLTMAEDFFQRHVGIVSSGGNFLQYYISLIVYPNVSVILLTIAGVVICVVNLAIYMRRGFRSIRRHQRAA